MRSNNRRCGVVVAQGERRLPSVKAWQNATGKMSSGKYDGFFSGCFEGFLCFPLFSMYGNLE
jgi:hypothetical protein